MTSRTVWPVVALVMFALACITLLSLFNRVPTELLQVIATAVVPTVTVLLVGERVSHQVGEVHKQVNGRMSGLIDKLPPADRPSDLEV